MPDSPYVAVAKAITTELTAAFAAGTFGAAYVDVVPERSYGEWDRNFEDLDELAVDVVPASADMELITRGAFGYAVTTAIAIRKRFGTAEQESSTGRVDIDEQDALTRLVQLVGEYFAPKQPSQDGRRLADLPEASWLPSAGQGKSGTEFRLWAASEDMRQRTFAAIVRITYQVPV